MKTIKAGLFICMIMLAITVSGIANAGSLSVNYYTDSGNDFGTGGAQWGTYYNEVTSTLGPDGLPVLNSAYSGYITDVSRTTGEILWWNPSLNNSANRGTIVNFTGSGTVSLPFVNYMMYPPNATGFYDGPPAGFQAAEFTGTITLPQTEKVTFTLGADDDAFLYVNGNLVSSLGGIHGISPAPTTTETLAAGTYSLNLFYADQMPTGAALYFSVDTQGVTTNQAPSVPEPSTFLLFGAGIAGVAFFRKRMKA